MGSRPETVSNPVSCPVGMANMNSMKITTLFLDYDNTLVQSESLAFEASADPSNEILAARHVVLSFTGRCLQRELVGQNFQDMIRAIESKFNVSCNISDKKLEHYASMEDDRVISLMQKLEPCEGANSLSPLYTGTRPRILPI
ncbi:hypothetical protein Forpe1208_v004351 [Fusarium oxysporum f. sp. rapae]|uniref:Uncharacterized protein n=1 Tax=Fusarium oxysporum f. sp. rapae TaxID=485398 RepID=A0A8J5PEH8_FUSOX|nr:hypothetical protein Forpe1208_v004351 [Fusarium oxysporum f. sp. rapae]